MLKRKESKLVSDLADRIHENIASGAYAPGKKLRQEALAREFNVSRTPIREALMQLEAKGIISQKQRQGAVIRKPSSRDIREIYAVRAELEGLAAQLAANWITDQQLVRLHAIHEQFSLAVKQLCEGRSSVASKSSKGTATQKNALKNWVNTNAEFHALIYEASNNHHLIRTIDDLRTGFTKSILVPSALGMYRHRMQQNIVHHEEILAALEHRRPAEARAAMAKHIMESCDFVVAWFERQSDVEEVE
jgi:DNA-binding GntR family transcriptional regulator